MQESELDIIYEDDAIIVCYKPAGIATQTKRLGQQDMESLLKNYRAKKGEVPYIGVVHRLDQPVEGIMVFAKTQKAAAELSKQVQKREIGKHYYAIAPFSPNQREETTLIDYLLADRKNNLTRVVAKGTPQAQQAGLDYKIQKKQPMGEGALSYAWYDIKLHTGRHHQIRVQFANMGCPLFGDTKYGDTTASGALALCSYRLEFVHPSTGERLDFSVKPRNPAFELFK